MAEIESSTYAEENDSIENSTYTEENDSNEAKSLALDERIKKEIEKAPKDKEGNVLLKPTVEIGGTLFELNIEKDKEENSYNISILGVNILKLDENDEFSFVDGWEVNLREQLRNNQGVINEEAVIRDLKEMEANLLNKKEEQQKGTQQKGSQQKDEKDLSKEKEEEEQPEREEQPEKDGATKSTMKKDSSWIEIRGDRETDEMRTFNGMLKKEYPELAEGADRFFVAPNPKDANDYNLYATDAQGNIVAEIPLEHTEGKNPMDEDILTYEKDGTNAKTQQPVQILKIGNSINGAMLVITGGTRTGTQVHIGNRSRGDDYNTHEISSSLSQKEFMDAEESVKQATSSTYGEREQGSWEKKYYDTLSKLEKQGVPDESNPAKDKNGISVAEIEVESFDDLNASLAATFAKEYGISMVCAKNVATQMLEGGKDFDDALLEGFKIEEKEGRIAPGSAEKRTEQVIDYSKSGPEKDTEEPEKLPGQGPRSGN